MLRGHKIEFRDGQFFYCDTGEPTVGNRRSKCGHCGLEDTPEGHDGCLGTIPGLMNACCGHGESGGAYIQYPCGRVISGREAVDWIKEHG